VNPRFITRAIRTSPACAGLAAVTGEKSAWYAAGLVSVPAKRGGSAVHVPLDEALVETPPRCVAVLALDDALAALSKTDPRKGRVVELRYFGGLSVEESAEVLQVAPETVMRDWKLAKAWLYRELAGKQSGT